MLSKLNDFTKYFHDAILISSFVLLTGFSSVIIAQTNFAVKLDGVDDNVRFPDYMISGPGPMTIELWIKTADQGVVFGHQNQQFLNTGSTFPSSRVPILYIGTDGKLNATFWAGNTTPITSSVRIDDNAWHHIALVSTGSGQILYVDGHYQGEKNAQVSISLRYNQVGAGSNEGWSGSSGDNWDPINATIDEMRLWNTARTEYQINTFKANTYIEDEPGLVSVWHFDEGEDLLADDNFGEKQATLENGTQWVYSDIPANDSNDAGVADVKLLFDDSPNGMLQVPIRATIKNYGENPLNNVSVYWKLTDLNGLDVDHTLGWEGNLSTGDTMSFIIGYFDFQPGTFYNLMAKTLLPNNGVDFNPANDSVEINDIVVSPSTDHYSLVLDGINDYMEIGGNPDFISNGIEGEYTVDMWLKLDRYKTGFVFGDEHSFNNGVMMEFNNQGYYETFVNNHYCTSTFRPDLNTWYHIAQVQDETGIHLYVNGKYYQSLVNNQFQIDTPDPLKVGAFYIGGQHDRFFSGSIDNLKIWDKAMGDSLIDELFLSEYFETRPGLVAFYDFWYDEGTFPNPESFVVNKVGSIVNDGTLKQGSVLSLSDSPVDDWTCYGRDVGIETILSPVNGKCNYSNKEKVGVILRNYGSFDLSNLNISYVVAGTTDTVFENIGNLIIPALDTNLYTFDAPVDLSQPGRIYEIIVKVSLPGDYSYDNNTLTQEIDYSVSGVRIEGDTIVCYGEPAILYACCADTILWSTGQTGDQLIVTPGSTTTYWAMASGNNPDNPACPQKDSITVAVVGALDTLPKVINSGETTLCYGDTVYLTSNIHQGDPSQYLWNTGGIGSRLSVSQTGIYYYTYTSVSGCMVFSDTIEVSVLPQVYIEPSTSSSLCIGDSVQLTVSNSSHFKWSTGDTSNVITVFPAYSTTFFVIDTNDFGCIYTDSIRINVYPKTILDITGDTMLCEGDQSVLQAKSSSTGTYMWNTGEKNNKITVQPLVNTTYRLIFTDIYGCRNSDSLRVKVFYYPQRPAIVTHGPTSVCEGGQVLFSTPIQENIEWSTGNIEPEIFVSKNTDIYVAYIGQNNCRSYSDTIPARFMAKPQLTTDLIYVACSGDSLQLEVNNITSILWSTGDTSSAITVVPDRDTTYSFDAFNTPWCQVQDSVAIHLVPSEAVPGMVVNMLPPDSTISESSGVNLSWKPDSIATAYDLYIWKFDQERPVVPTVPDITGINYLAKVSYGQKYNWQVVSKTPCHKTESPVRYFYTRNKPDIQVTQIESSEAISGQTFDVTWTVSNTGKGAANMNKWFDRVWLSQDNTNVRIGEKEDILLGEFEHVRVLDTMDSYQNTQRIKIPPLVSGAYYLFVITDDLDALNINLETMESTFTHGGKNVNNLTETNDRNNFNFIPIQITTPPPPDLQVSSVQLPAINSFFSGQRVKINWQTINKGISSTNTDTWYEELILSGTDYLSPDSYHVLLKTVTHKGILQPDSFSVHTDSIDLPEGIQGTFYLIVNTDSKNEVYEYAYEENNSRAGNAFQIMLKPPVDLAIVSADCQDTVPGNRSMKIKYTVANQGLSKTVQPEWSDRIGLGLSPDLEKGMVTWIKTVRHSGYLEPGEQYTDSAWVTIPDRITGPYYVFINCDIDNTIYEHHQEENNFYHRVAPVVVVNPDIVVSQVDVADTALSGNVLTVEWTVQCQGKGVATKNHFDRVYLSESTGNDTSRAIVLGTFNQMGILLPGDSMKYTKNVLVPHGIAGDYYLFVLTDLSDNEFEGQMEDNNFSSAKFLHINLSPQVDLSPLSLDIGDTLICGKPNLIEYVVGNLSSTDLNSVAWTDNIYLSGKDIFDPDNAMFLAQVGMYDTVKAGSSYSRQIKTSLSPYLKTGYYFAYIQVDATDNIYEHESENNNVLRSDSLFVLGYPPVDLKAGQFSAPSIAATGDEIKLEYAISNISQNNTIPEFWSNALYLSKDTIWDSDDIMISHWPQYGPLESGDTNWFDQAVKLPETTFGNYYLLLVADYLKENNDSDFKNNIARDLDAQGMPGTINISLSPPVDLTLGSWSVPEEGISGQPLEISWTTINQGVGDTRVNQWTEKVYLSADFKLDAKDKLIGSYKHQEGLGAGTGYDAEMTVDLPLSSSGNYVLIFVVDDGNQVYEHEAEDNNIFTRTITLVKPLPSDLMLTRVTSPEILMAGGDASLSWNLRNIGLNLAAGVMKNTMYLSKDKILDEKDMLIARKYANINLASGAEASQQATVHIPGVPVGEYYILVYTDAGNNIPETDEDNNLTASEAVHVHMAGLHLSEIAQAELPDNTSLYYRLEIADSLSGETLLTVLNSIQATQSANELYISYEQVPTRYSYDYKHSRPVSADQEVLIPSLQAGDYYLMVYGNSTSDNKQDIELLARKLNFEVTSVETNKGGNTGTVTVKVEGSKFSGIRSAKLVSKQGDAITAQRLYSVNPCLMYATFDLKDKNTGMFDFVLEKYSGEKAELTDGFEIENGQEPSVSVFVEHPERARINRIVPMTINYSNDGNIDVPIPQRYVISRDGAYIASTEEGLEYCQTSKKVSLGEDGTPLSVLRPGASGKIILYTQPRKIEKLRFILTK